MFQLPPGMNYKQFQAAGMPGYKSDVLPYKEGGYINSAGGSVSGGRHPLPPVNIVSRTADGGYINDRGGSVRGGRQPLPSVNKNTAPAAPKPQTGIWGGKNMTYEGLVGEGYHPDRAKEIMAEQQKFFPAQQTPSMPRYDQAQPVQQPSQGTPYGAFDQGRLQMGNQPPAPKRPTSPPPAQPSQGRSNPYGFYDANGNVFPGTISFAPGTSEEKRQKAYERFANDSGFFSPGTAPPTMAPPQKRAWGDAVPFNGQQGSWNGGQQFGQMPQAGNSMFAGGWPDATRTPSFGGFGQPMFGGGQQFGGFNPWQQPPSFPGAQRPFANGGTPQGFLPGMWAY